MWYAQLQRNWKYLQLTNQVSFCFYGHFFNFFKVPNWNVACNGNCSIHLLEVFVSPNFKLLSYYTSILRILHTVLFIYLPVHLFIYLFNFILIYGSSQMVINLFTFNNLRNFKVINFSLTKWPYILPKKGSQGAKQWKKVHISIYMYL